MLVGGKTAIYAIDPATGSYSQVGSLGAGIDLRGADEWFSNVTLFGSGCAGSHGNVALGVTGSVGPGLQVRVVSGNHAASALGAMVVGFSRTNFQGAPLPMLLDPLVGTQGCSLLTSVDVPMFGLCSAVAPATLDLPLALPAAAAGFVLHVQHVVFEPVTGGLSASNAATLFVGY
jgi:hypothetical protein